MIDKELKKRLKKAAEEIINEEKKKREFLNKNIDYEFLQKLVDTSYENPELLINIYLKSGDKITITQKSQEPERIGFDGQPNTIEVR